MPRRRLRVPYVPPEEVRRRLCERLALSEDAWGCNESEAGLPREEK